MKVLSWSIRCCILALAFLHTAQAQTHVHHEGHTDEASVAAGSAHDSVEAQPRLWRVHGTVAHAGGGAAVTEVLLSATGWHYRFEGRVEDGRSHVDAGGQSFGTRYGYAEPHVAYTRYHVSLARTGQPWTYGGTLMLGPGAPTPDLRMDEQEHRMWSAFLGYRGHQLYAEQMHHRMDNRLRTRMADMSMRADVLAIGIRGAFYELSYRTRDTWHTMDMPHGMDMLSAENAMDEAAQAQHVIPNLHELQLGISHEHEQGRIALAGELSIRFVAAGDRAPLSALRLLHPVADASRWFVPFSLQAAYTTGIAGAWSAALKGTVAAEPPAPTELFVVVQRVHTDVSWLGNPTLASSRKVSLSGAAYADGLHAEVYATVVKDYARIAPAGPEGSRLLTFAHTDAFFVGFTLKTDGRYLTGRATYTWAQELGTAQPIAGIAPLHLAGAVTLPVHGDLCFRMKGEMAAAQRRVDPRVAEETVPSWGQLGADLVYTTGPLTVTAGVENLTDHLYYRHRSHVRDPFASGVHVYEPGRSLHLRVDFTY